MSKAIHRIRLVGPWEWAVSALETEWKKLRLPDDWSSLAPQNAEVSFRRRFHRPTGIQPNDRLFIVISTLGALSRVQLNGHDLRAVPGPARVTGEQSFEISGKLEEINLLQLMLPQLTADESHARLDQPVLLEILAQS